MSVTMNITEVVERVEISVDEISEDVSINVNESVENISIAVSDTSTVLVPPVFAQRLVDLENKEYVECININW